eukprot:COSAG02_NODE_18283_length_948_cov_1.480565_2_plen_146_part_00
MNARVATRLFATEPWSTSAAPPYGVCGCVGVLGCRERATVAAVLRAGGALPAQSLIKERQTTDRGFAQLRIRKASECPYILSTRTCSGPLACIPSAVGLIACTVCKCIEPTASRGTLQPCPDTQHLTTALCQCSLSDRYLPCHYS